MRTILMLCSMAYFFALFTVSCCSDVTFGRPAPRIPGNVRYLAPGPATKSLPPCNVHSAPNDGYSKYDVLSDLISYLSTRLLSTRNITSIGVITET